MSLWLHIHLQRTVNFRSPHLQILTVVKLLTAINILSLNVSVGELD